MTDYYVVALGLTRAEDLYVGFRRPIRSDGVCWPLPWAGTWSEAEVGQAAAELNDGVETIAVPREAVHALATEPAPGRIEGDVGPVVRNSASNRRALVLAARRDTTRMEAFGIPPAGDAARDDEGVSKALARLLQLLNREGSPEDERLWRLRADLLATRHSGDRRRGERAIQAVNEAAAVVGAGTVAAERSTPQRPVHPSPGPGQAEAAILRPPPPSLPPRSPSPDTEVSAKPVKP